MTHCSRTMATALFALLAALPLWWAASAEAALGLSVREIDLGVLGPGESGRAQFQITNTAAGSIRWTIEAPAGWEPQQARLSGESGAAPSRVDVALDSLRGESGADEHPMQLRIASGGRVLAMKRTLADGPWREALRIDSDGGGRTLFLKFRLTDTGSRPVLEAEPRGIDLGETEPVREITRTIRVSNSGAGVLRWQAFPGGAGTAPGAGRIRYLSLYNESLQAGRPYAAPAELRDALQLSGPWTAEKGYPKASGFGCALRIRIPGADAVLTGRRASETILLRSSVGEQPPREVTLEETDGGRFEATLSERLPEGPHSLHLQVAEGTVILEGFSVRDDRVTTPPAAWIRLAPLSGTTTRETDFVTVRMTLTDLKPGVYTDQVTISSNGGTVRIPVSFGVSGEAAPRHLAVWRYTRGEDILYTAQPEKEDSRYIGAYRRTGPAFRLYGPGTAGTAELHRWYNPSIGDHYYSAERSGGRKNLQGYIYGGTVGNIATIRLPGTRELYCWFNAETGRHYFTTDAAGEGIGRRGYRFEGTVGFVLR